MLGILTLYLRAHTALKRSNALWRLCGQIEVEEIIAQLDAFLPSHHHRLSGHSFALPPLPRHQEILSSLQEKGEGILAFTLHLPGTSKKAPLVNLVQNRY